MAFNKAEVLTRSELKKVIGGDFSGSGTKCSTSECSLVVQNTAGGWNTYYGECSGSSSSCFCDIGQPVNIPITSNGGVSRCVIG